MSCDPYFNIFSLSSSSQETEIGWSTQCVPNSTKLALFILLLVLATWGFSFFAYFTWLEFKHSRAWTLKKKIYLAQTVGLGGLLILIILYLSGVQSRARYLLVPFIGNSIFAAAALLIEVIVHAFAEGVRNSENDHRVVVTKKIMSIFIAGVSIAQYVLSGIVPLVVYETPYLLNVFYTAGVTLTMLGTVVVCTTCALIFHRLAVLMDSNPEVPLTSDLAAVKSKLMMMAVSSSVFAGAGALGLFFPIWIGLTAVNGDPGMKGIFYFHFCGLLMYQLSGSATLFWAAAKAKASHEGGSSSHDTSHSGRRVESEKEREKDQFSFTVDEINMKA